MHRVRMLCVIAIAATLTGACLFAVKSPATAGEAEVADKTLLGDWRFDEGVGDVAADRSGHGNDAEIHGAVRVRAEHDALTGLRNHGSFQRELGEALAHGSTSPISILMLDLDSFKGYNDACGHPAGDSLLAALATVLKSATRDGDCLYRYGGDEFAAILPGADRQAAHEVAERIRHGVSELSDTIGGPRVTISTGVACYPDDGRTKDLLVGVADPCLHHPPPGGWHRPGSGHRERSAAT